MNNLIYNDLNMYEPDRLKETIEILENDIAQLRNKINRIEVELKKRWRILDHMKSMSKEAKTEWEQYKQCYYEEIGITMFWGNSFYPLYQIGNWWANLSKYNGYLYSDNRLRGCHNTGYRYHEETFVFICDSCGAMSGIHKELEKSHAYNIQKGVN